VHLADLLHAHYTAAPWLQAVPLLLQRESGKVLLPGKDETILIGDHLLFCGTPEARSSLFWNLHDPDALRPGTARRAQVATTVVSKSPGATGARNA